MDQQQHFQPYLLVFLFVQVCYYLHKVCLPLTGVEFKHFCVVHLKGEKADSMIRMASDVGLGQESVEPVVLEEGKHRAQQ